MIEWFSVRWKGQSPGSKLSLILLPLIVLDIVLLAINITVYNFHNTIQIPILNDNKTSLTFDGKSSYHDGNLEFLIDNNEKSSSKTLNVYGLDSHYTINGSSSYLVDDTHKIDTTAKLTINRNNAVLDPELYVITVPAIQNLGSYDSWIFVNGKENIAIPITLSTEPKVLQALLWVIIGIFTSIIFWEIIEFVGQLKKAQTYAQLTPEKTNEIAVNNLTTEQIVTNIAQNLKVIDLPVDNVRRIKRQINEQLDPQVRDTLEKDLNKKLTSKAFVKVSIIDLGSLVFGIAVGFLALLSQGYVTAIRVFGPIEVLALVGLGLGIGSLREFLNKD